MNIFFLSLNPRECAHMYYDKHVIKILLEICQMLYAAHDVSIVKLNAPWNQKKTRRGYAPSHKNHPMCMWVRSSQKSYITSATLGMCLALEYNKRFKKVHACSKHIAWLYDNIPKTFDETKSEKSYYSNEGIPECMPEKYHHPSIVVSYQRYMSEGKEHIRKPNEKVFQLKDEVILMVGEE